MIHYDDAKVRANKPLTELINLSSQQDALFKRLLKITGYSISDLAAIVYRKKYKPSDAHYRDFEQLNRLNDEYGIEFYNLAAADDVDEDELQAVIDFFTD